MGRFSATVVIRLCQIYQLSYQFYRVSTGNTNFLICSSFNPTKSASRNNITSPSAFSIPAFSAALPLLSLNSIISTSYDCYFYGIICGTITNNYCFEIISTFNVCNTPPIVFSSLNAGIMAITDMFFPPIR